MPNPSYDSGQLVCKIGRAAGDIDPRHATLSLDLRNMEEVAWSTFYAFLGSRSGPTQESDIPKVFSSVNIFYEGAVTSSGGDYHLIRCLAPCGCVLVFLKVGCGGLGARREPWPSAPC